MAASVHLLLPALSERPADLSARPDDHAPRPCVPGAEGARREAPPAGEPPLPEAGPRTGEPPLAAADADRARP